MRQFEVTIPGVGTIPNQMGQDESTVLRNLYPEVQCSVVRSSYYIYDVKDHTGAKQLVMIREVFTQ